MPTWYIYHQHQQVGPVSGRQLRELARAGRLGLRTPVRAKGERKWRRAEQLAGLFTSNQLPPLPPLPRKQAIPSIDALRHGDPNDFDQPTNHDDFLTLDPITFFDHTTEPDLPSVEFDRLTAAAGQAPPPPVQPEGMSERVVALVLGSLALIALIMLMVWAISDDTPAADSADINATDTTVSSIAEQSENDTAATIEQPTSSPPTASNTLPPSATTLSSSPEPVPTVPAAPIPASPPETLEQTESPAHEIAAQPPRQTPPPAAVPTSASQPAHAATTAPIKLAPRQPWANATEDERAATLGLIQQHSWTARCFGLQCLARYSGTELDFFIRQLLKDEAWQVRCFAIAAGVRHGLHLQSTDFLAESEPRVLRTALRHGIPLNEEQVSRQVANMLSDVKSLAMNERLLAIELATAANQRLQAQCQALLTDIVARLTINDLVLHGPAIARMLADPPGEARRSAWLAWLRSHADATLSELIVHAAPPELPLPVIATLDAQTLDRVSAYVGELKQRRLQLAILVDATSSMEPVIIQIRAGINELVQVLGGLADSMDMAVVGYRDDGSYYYQPMTNNISALQEWLRRLTGHGGRGFGGVLIGLSLIEKLEWQDGTNRQVIIIGDAAPRPDRIADTTTTIGALGKDGFTFHALATEPQAFTDLTRAIRTTGGRVEAFVHGGSSLTTDIIKLSLDESVWPVLPDFITFFATHCL